MEFITKLPSGQTWWNVASSHCGSWQQQSYACPAQPSSKVEESSCHHPPAASSGQPASGTNGTNGTKRRMLWDMVLATHDTCYELYNSEQKRFAEGMIREMLKEFVLDPMTQKYFGPKKCRLIYSCLSNNPIQKENYRPFQEFLEFVLDIHVSQIHQDRHGNWFVI